MPCWQSDEHTNDPVFLHSLLRVRQPARRMRTSVIGRQMLRNPARTVWMERSSYHAIPFMVQVVRAVIVTQITRSAKLTFADR